MTLAHLTIRLLLVLVISLFSIGQASAGITNYNNVKKGIAINANAKIDVRDDWHDAMVTFGTLSKLRVRNNEVTNKVIFKYDGTQRAYYDQSWTVTLTFNVDIYKEGEGQPSQTYSNQTLVLNYAPAGNYQDIAVWTTTGGHRMVVDVVSVVSSTVHDPGPNPDPDIDVTSTSEFRSDFILEAEIEVDRDICMRYEETVTPQISIDQTAMTALITWDVIVGAEVYDLEWVYVSKYSVNELDCTTACSCSTDCITTLSKLDFDNATRITTGDNHYTINLPYEEGDLHFRVRGKGDCISNSDFTINIGIGNGLIAYGLPIPENGAATKWSPTVTEPITPTTSDFDDENDRNWTYNAIYAEDGKRKEVFNVYDGSLRERQVVTINNTENQAVVGETMYDYEGRAAVQILPAPVLPSFTGGNSQIKFYDNFNLNNSSAAFTKADFDEDDTYTDLLGTSSGAAKYYSSNNDHVNEIYNSFIPDAEQYPYVRTLYGRDGRIKRQSAPGAAHRLDSDHETKYYYVTPDQEKLDRLFGNEVGPSKNYRLNMVRDANGQISLSYEKMNGQVIATSLAGLPHSEDGGTTYLVDELDDNVLTEDFIVSYNNDNHYLEGDQVVLIDRSIPVTTPGEYKFTYTLSATDYEYFCQGMQGESAYSVGEYTCKYDLIFEIFNEFDEPVYDYDGVTVGYDPESPHSTSILHSSITNITTTTPSPLVFYVDFEEIGSYKLRKVLRLNEAHLQAEVDQFLTDIQNTDPQTGTANCWLDPDDFVITPDLTECGSCPQGETCTISLHDIEDEDIDCSALEELIIADMSPGGQYFENEFLGHNPDDDSDNGFWFKDHVLADYNGSTGPQAEWDKMGFFQPDGTTPIYTYADLKAYWKPEWLYQEFKDYSNNPPTPATITITHNSNDFQFSQLIQFHPEYCNLMWCYNMQESNVFDLKLQATETYADAEAAGFFDCTPPTGLEIWETILEEDPYFVSGGFGEDNGFRDEMEDYLSDPDNNTSTTESLWEALLSEYYDDELGCTVTASPCSTIAISGTPSECTKDDFWLRFRHFYLFYKEKVTREHKTTSFSCSATTSDYSSENYKCPTLPSSSCTGTGGCPYLYTEIDMEDPISASIPPDFVADSRPSPNCHEAFLDDRAEGFEIHVLNLGQEVEESDFVDGTLSNSEFEDLAEDWENDVTSYYDPCILKATSIPSIKLDGAISYLEVNVAGGDLTSTCSSNSTVSIRVEYGSPTQTINLGTITQNTTSPGLTAFYQAIPGIINDLSHSDFVFLNNGDGTFSIIPKASTGTTYADAEIKLFCDENDVMTLGTITGCETLYHPHCLCTEMEMLETMFDNGDLKCPDGTLDCASNGSIDDVDEVIAEWYLDNYPSLGIDGTDIDDWRANCASTKTSDCGQTPQGFSNESTCTRDATVTIPTELNCEADPFDCERIPNAIAGYHGTLAFQKALEKAKEEFIAGYIEHCLTPPEDGGGLTEHMSAEYDDREYHFTLYYYDQSGNLTRTVPPEGVEIITDPDELEDVQDHRDEWPCTMCTNDAVFPPHRMVTTYQYDSYNNLRYQETPDGGESEFWYDRLGRIRLSQDARQRANSTTNANIFSYTQYDEQSRITEVGQHTFSTELTSKVNQTTNPITNEVLNDVEKMPGQTWWEHYLVSREQVTQTTYDEATTSLITQENLRNRVAKTEYLEDPATPSDNDQAYHYTYDIHGNVDKMLNEFSILGFDLNTKLEYEYDLVSGNVNQVKYQEGQADQFFHKYVYDADNRITHAFTSKDGMIWDMDGKYMYYAHGPLARAELGDKKVQGTDYAYTLHGWLKGVNSNILDPERDMGKDGVEAATYQNGGGGDEGLHYNFASDAYGFSLGYYNFHQASPSVVDLVDYQSISSAASKQFEATLWDGSNLLGPRIGTSNLYNGNISHMVTSIYDATNQTTPEPMGYGYRYDQLNRLKKMQAYDDLDATLASAHADYNDWGSTGALSKYKVELTYDANGNIETLKRWDDAGTAMDNLVYRYHNSETTGFGNGTLSSRQNNKLLLVNDDAGVTAITEDLEDQGYFEGALPFTFNYNYDEIGNLIKDKAEDIDNIEWNAYGKISKITRTGTVPCSTATGPCSSADLEFLYDANGNRIMKIVKPRDDVTGDLKSADHWSYQYYSRDPQGNVMGIYEIEQILGGSGTTLTRKLNLLERSLYGSDRLGIIQHSSYQIREDGYFQLELSPGVYQWARATITNYNLPDNTFERELGEKRYELKNHLGNVLTTVSDKKVAVEDGVTAGEVEYYIADITSLSDYYPFGMQLPERTFQAGYRYGFNGKEQDSEVSGQGNQYDYGFRIYNPRLGKFLSVDPLTSSYPYYTPYQFAGNSPITYLDLDGLERYYYKLKIDRTNNEITLELDRVEDLEERTLVVYQEATQWLDPGDYRWEKVINQRVEIIIDIYDPGYGNGREGRTKTTREYADWVWDCREELGVMYSAYHYAGMFDTYDHIAILDGKEELSNADKDQHDSDFALFMSMVFLEGFCVPKPLRVNIYGEGEAIGYIDYATEAFYSNGRPLTKELASSSVDDLFMRWAPLSPTTLAEIDRIVQVGTRFKYINNVEAPSLFNTLLEKFGHRAIVLSDEVITIGSGTNAQVVRQVELEFIK